MKTTMVFTLLIIAVLLFTGPVDAISKNDLSTDEAADIIKAWEHIYMIAFYENDFNDYMLKDDSGQVKDIELAEHERRMYNSIDYEKTRDPYIYPCRIQTVSELREFIGKTYTEEMTEKIINNSMFLIRNNRVFYSGDILDGTYPVAVSEKYDYMPPITERISITDLSDDYKQIEFIYWEATVENIERWLYSENSPSFPMSESKKGALTVKKTSDGYRICAFDNILIKEDKYAIDGYRPLRFAKNNPQTSDAPVIAVCALALSALAAAVVLRKKR